MSRMMNHRKSCSKFFCRKIAIGNENYSWYFSLLGFSSIADGCICNHKSWSLRAIIVHRHMDMGIDSCALLRVTRSHFATVVFIKTASFGIIE
jgi:hypothetical protein